MTTYIPSTGHLGALVFDCGSVFTKAGFAGDDQPATVFSSTVGRWEEDDTTRSVVELDCLGWEQYQHLKVQRLSFPRTAEIREALTEELCRHALQKLGASAAEHPFVLSEPIGLNVRQRTAEIFFEEFGVPALCVAKSAELAALSVGRTTALVMDIGGYESTSTPVVDGVAALRSFAR